MLVLLILAASPAGVASAQTATTTPSASTTVSPSPAAGSEEGLSPVAIVIGLILIGGTLLFRTRMGRAGR